MKQPPKRAKNPDTPEATSKYYLTNAKLLPEVLRAKTLGRMTNELAGMLMMLARKYAQRPSFANYTYKEDMISEALTNLCQNALKFNPEKSNNPFAYYTTCIHSSFLQFLNIEKKHRRIRDQLLVEIGENPSFNFIEEQKSQNSAGGEFKNELSDLKIQIEEARERTKLEAEQAVILAAEQAALKKAAEETAASLLTFDDVDVDPEHKLFGMRSDNHSTEVLDEDQTQEALDPQDTQEVVDR